MSVADNWNTPHLHESNATVTSVSDRPPLHRIAEVRRQQGVSVRSVTRKLGLTAEEVRLQEEPTSDLTMSQLFEWQRALDVPLANLLVDLDAPLSGPVLSRARLLRVMKTVQAILDSTKEKGVERMATMLVDQLVELMPELRHVSGWHSVGQRRTQDELGRIAERPISDNFIQDSLQ